MSRIRVAGLDFAEFLAEAKTRALPSRGLGAALYRSVFQTGSFECEEMAPESLASWRETFEPGLLEILDILEEPGEFGVTKKVRFGCPDGLSVESVLIPMPSRPDTPPRRTLCVSSQIGCRMGCVFCRTGGNGLTRNLEAWEIVAQALTARCVLKWEFGNIVFMGMGEPLDNFDSLARALAVLSDQRGPGYAAERITICTSGIPEGIAKLKSLGYRRMGLSVSLSAADPDLRMSLMPGAAALASPDELAEALAAYPARRNFVLGVNVCLIPGVNDSPEDARRIAGFCGKIGRCLVNVIPYNPGENPIARSPSEEETGRFLRELESLGLKVRARAAKGSRIMGACGQLAAPGAPRVGA
ncbi:MAG: radical SAM protein [Rectinema sp.]